MKTKLFRPTDREMASLRRAMQTVKQMHGNPSTHSDMKVLAAIDYQNLHHILTLCLQIRDGKTLFE